MYNYGGIGLFSSALTRLKKYTGIFVFFLHIPPLYDIL